MTSFFRGHYQYTLKLNIFIHSNCFSDIISQYHTPIIIEHIIYIARLLRCGVQGVKYTDMIQNKEEIWAAPMDFEDRFKKADHYIFARNTLFSFINTGAYICFILIIVWVCQWCESESTDNSFFKRVILSEQLKFGWMCREYWC